MADTQRKQSVGQRISFPKAVIINDVHYNVNTLVVADSAVRSALRYAESENLPLIVAGDLHDTKAMLRGECVKAMIDTFSSATTRVVVIVGNHCRLSEKAPEHSLEFLRPYAQIVDKPIFDDELGLHFIPYYHDSAELQALLSATPPGSTLILHQGVQTAYMGHYLQDKSSLPKEAFADFRAISGHYHKRQDIKCGRPRKGAIGLFSYTGNPYSLNFGEAQDGNKGFNVLMDDGTLEFHALNLRKHVVLETTAKHWRDIEKQNPSDLVWLKVKGLRSELSTINKAEVAKFVGNSNFKLDLIPTDEPQQVQNIEQLSDEELFDDLIDNLEDNLDYKTYLKTLWREALS